jgi:hypothetical protein
VSDAKHTPELLEALKELVKRCAAFYDDMGDMPADLDDVTEQAAPLRVALKAAEAAIAKAERQAK